MSEHKLTSTVLIQNQLQKSESEKPKRLDYPKNKIKYRHYGKKIELLIDQACKLKKEEDKESAVIHIGKIMKSFFSMWNKESIDNNVIVDNIKELSNNKLTIDIEKVKELNLFYKVTKEEVREVTILEESILEIILEEIILEEIQNQIDLIEKGECNEFIQN